MGLLVLGILAWVLLGAVAWYVATIVLADRGGIAMTVALWVVGGLLGGRVAAAVLHDGRANGLNVYSVLIAIAGMSAMGIITWRALATRATDQSPI
jgi:uncharacterized membrane protein YeaQ/YmgE (transglycosylase-associated protein family)